MGLYERLNDDLKGAMRAGDELVRSTLRHTLAAAKNRRIELGRDLEDADVLEVLARGVKTRRDSVTQYRDAGREELAVREEAEIGVLEAYLPQALSEDETRASVVALIAELGLSSKRDLGTLMKAVMARHKGAVDGKLVSRLAGELLS